MDVSDSKTSRFAVFALTWSVVAIGLAPAALADGDAANDEKIFQQCAACRSPQKGVNMFGPSLYHVVGRPADSQSSPSNIN